jgi:hypothetical protein
MARCMDGSKERLNLTELSPIEKQVALAAMRTALHRGKWPTRRAIYRGHNERSRTRV